MVIEADVKLIGYGIDVAAYKKFSPKLRANEFGRNKYVAPFSFFIQMACRDYINWQHPFTPFPKPTDDVCDFFIEDGDWKPGAMQAIAESRSFPYESYWRNRVGSDTFGKKAAQVVGAGPVIPLLQVADFGAFFANKALTNAPDLNIPWRPYYDRLVQSRKICYQLETLTEAALKQHYAIFGALKMEEQGIDIWREVSERISTLAKKS